jgi:protein-S-isoprenylcysteine O-methyltransferase Ste14
MDDLTPIKHPIMFPGILLSSAWLAYYIVHSWLASHHFKRIFAHKFPLLFPRYRLLYNLASTLLLIPPLGLLFFYPWAELWSWQGSLSVLSKSIGLVSIAGFLFSLRYYDGSAFIGLTPNTDGHIGSVDEPFTLSPLHRFVRHPWYFLGLLFIWSQDMNTGWFITCSWATLYMFVGSRLEEKKLIVEYGEVYTRYCDKVPSLIPLPWRYLNKKEADQLIQLKN